MRSSSRLAAVLAAALVAGGVYAPVAQAATVGVDEGVCTVTVTERDVDAHATWPDAGPYPAAGDQFLIVADLAPVTVPGLDGYAAALQDQIQGLYGACADGTSTNVPLARSDGRGVLPENPLAGSSVEGGLALLAVAAGAVAVGYFWPLIAPHLPDLPALP